MNHGNADGLSRRSCTNAECADCGVALQHGCEHKSLSPKIQAAAVKSLEFESKPNWMDVWSLKQIREWQVADDEINNILYFKSVSQYPPTSPEVVRKEFRSYLNQWDLLSVENDVLCRHWYEHDSDRESRVIIAPKQLRRELFYHLHELRTGGHLGIKRTVYQLQRRFYWPGLQSDVRTWCRWCVICAKRKPTHGRHRGLLKQSVATAPMERIAIDILGPLPKTVSGNEYIMVISDYFTKWIECYALPDQQAYTVADALVTKFFTRFEVPYFLHTDQGRDFESQLFQHVYDLLGIQKTRTSPYRPQSDGLVERFNRTI